VMCAHKFARWIHALWVRALWLSRALEYGFRYFVLERPRGLDFSKRSRERKTLTSSTGYALTQKRALRNILSGCPIDEDSVFLDVGGGKSGTAVFALELGFMRSASLEYEEYLHVIAQRNIRKLGLGSRVDLIHGDALKFERYSDFSHIFMFFPMDRAAMTVVLDAISEQLNRPRGLFNRYHLMFYGGISRDDVVNRLVATTVGARLVSERTCPYRGNSIRVVEVVR
jgi:hypothetical protein